MSVCLFVSLSVWLTLVLVLLSKCIYSVYFFDLVNLYFFTIIKEQLKKNNQKSVDKNPIQYFQVLFTYNSYLIN